MTQERTEPAGSRMSYWIADALIDARERAGINPDAMSTVLGVHENTIRRLEEGHSYGRDIDSAIAAYADVTGIGDGRDLWWGALHLWYTRGTAPQFSSEGPAAAFAQAIRSTSQQLRPAHNARSKKSSPIAAPPWLADRHRQTGS